MDADVVALVVGEAVVDVVTTIDGHVAERPGGSAANVAVALARLGRPAWLATCFAHDHGGRLLAEHLATSGVRLAADPHTVTRTTTATAVIGADGAARYGFVVEWRPGPLSLLPRAGPQLVHTGSLGAVLRPGAERVRGVVASFRSGALVSYDLNVREAVTGTGPDVVAAVEQMVALADLVKASDEDLATLYPTDTEAWVVDRFLGLGAGAVLLTRGPRGADVVTPGGTVHRQPPPVAVVDTIGAGDTFAAAMLDRLWQLGVVGSGARHRLAGLGSSDWYDILGYALRAAAVTVSRAGADPPWRTELASD